MEQAAVTNYPGVPWVDASGVRHTLTPEQEAAAKQEPVVFTAQDQAVAALLEAQAKVRRDAQREEAQYAAHQQAEQRAAFEEIRGLLDPQLEQVVRETQATLHGAQAEVTRARAAVEAHTRLRPRAGATSKDIEAWAREKGMLAGMLEAHEGIVAEAAAAHQAARERLQAAMRRVLERRLAEMEQQLRQTDADWRAKEQAKSQELFDLRSSWSSDVQNQQAAIERLRRHWPQ